MPGNDIDLPGMYGDFMKKLFSLVLTFLIASAAFAQPAGSGPAEAYALTFFKN